MVDLELKAEWVEALRSGRYKQGRYALRQGDMFCCLGVLCDVVDPGGWVNLGGTKTSWDVEVTSDDAEEHPLSYPPSWLIKKMGLDEGDDDDPYPFGEALWKMNDLYGLSFLEIADFIEESLV